MKRACVYFAVALVLEFVLVFSGTVSTIFLIPGMILSGLISHGGIPAFVINLALNAAFYACLALLIEKAIRRRKLSN